MKYSTVKFPKTPINELIIQNLLQNRVPISLVATRSHETCMIFCSSTYPTFSYYSDRIKKFRSKHKRPTCHSSVIISLLRISGRLQILLGRMSFWETEIQIDKADTQMHHGQQPTLKSILHLSHFLHPLKNVGFDELLTVCKELFTSRPGPARRLNFQSSSQKSRHQQQLPFLRKLSTSLKMHNILERFSFFSKLTKISTTILRRHIPSRLLLPQLCHLSNSPSWSNIVS